jgi:S1-C subfamily serine protease
MTKVFEWVDKHAIKTLITMIIVCSILLGFVYLNGIRNDISLLEKRITSTIVANEETQDARYSLSLQVYEVILEGLQKIIGQNDFIIEQNRAKDQKVNDDRKVQTERKTKPSYEELKSHTVYIVGCSEKVLPDDKKIKYMLGDEEKGNCWSGTGSVVKITDSETYILTNNHVSGKGEPKVTLYVQNGKSKLVATIVKQHPYVDAAVIKVNGRLTGKTQIPGYAIAHIQDDVYIVGNPMGNKMTYSEGVVANFIGLDMLIQAPLIYGNSGSAIINKDGNLVGMCYALQMYPWILNLPAPQITHSLCVDGVSIQAFLKELGLINE